MLSGIARGSARLRLPIADSTAARMRRAAVDSPEFDADGQYGKR
jgi:hypothetical protein